MDGLNQVLANLDRYVEGVQRRCAEAMEEVCAALEVWAKTEHAYKDDTGANTNSIRAFVAEATPLLIRGVLSANMDYSIFLERARGGKWAFLMPVIERHMGDIREILDRRLRA